MYLYQKWNTLDLPTRNKIAEEFGIAKKVGIAVFNDTIQSDGFLFQEVEGALSHIAIERFCMHAEPDFEKLWVLFVDRIKNPLEPIELTETMIEMSQPVTKIEYPKYTPTKVKKVAKKSNAKKRKTK